MIKAESIFYAKLDHHLIVEIQSLLKSREKKLEYESKVAFYQRVFSRASSKLRICKVFGIPDTNILEGPFSGLYYELVEWNWLNEKCSLLDQIISLGNKVANNYNEEIELSFKQLEKKLINYLDEYDQFMESHYWEVVKSYLSNVTNGTVSLLNEIKFLKARLGILLKVIYQRTWFDMRQHIRSIVRFRFNKSDDDENVISVVASTSSMTLINVLNLSLWKKRKYLII